MSIMKKKNKETSEEIVEEVGSAATKIISKGIGALAGAAIGLSAGPAGAVVGAAAGEMLGEAVEIFIKKIPQIADAVKKVKREKAERKRSDMKLAGNIRASEIAKKSASKRSLESRLSVLEEKGNLENAVKEQLNGEYPHQEILVDAELDAGSANMKLVNKMSALEPFGQGNPEPTLVLYGATLRYASTMGKGAHLRGTVGTSNGTLLSFVGFNLVGTPVGDFLLDEANVNTKIMMLGKLKENDYNGRISAQFVLEDIAV